MLALMLWLMLWLVLVLWLRLLLVRMILRIMLPLLFHCQPLLPWLCGELGGHAPSLEAVPPSN
eukprot:COSAG02_NODE_52603_length_306_cov_74.951691_1_plen_62_part_10